MGALAQMVRSRGAQKEARQFTWPTRYAIELIKPSKSDLSIRVHLRSLIVRARKYLGSLFTILLRFLRLKTSLPSFQSVKYFQRLSFESRLKQSPIPGTRSASRLPTRIVSGSHTACALSTNALGDGSSLYSTGLSFWHHSKSSNHSHMRCSPKTRNFCATSKLFGYPLDNEF